MTADASLSRTRGIPTAGRELDALIAKKVMGWTGVRLRKTYRFPCGDGCGWISADVGALTGRHLAIAHLGDACVEVVPHYSTDMVGAWTVVASRAVGEWTWTLQQQDDGRWFAEVRSGYLTSYSQAFPVWAATAPLAICRAALAAVAIPRTDDGGRE